MNNIELIINYPANHSLDMGDFNISLNYAFNDIMDISKRNGSYSKTIIIPGTKNNNYVLGGLFDINSTFTHFNPNKKTNAKLLVNSEIVIDGFLHLTKINKNNEVDSQGNTIYYNMVLYSNSVDLITELGDKKISELTTLDEFSHIYNEANVVSSWGNSTGFVYPMIGTESVTSQFTTKHFYPATFYKTLLNAIIFEAGYGWTGSFKDNAQFNNEILPYTGNGTPKINDAGRKLKEFTVLITENTRIPFYNINTAGSLYYWDCDATPTLAISHNIPFDIEVSDPTNQINTTTFEGVVGIGGDYTFDLDLNYDIEWDNDSFNIIQSIGFDIEVLHNIQQKINGVWVTIDSLTINGVTAPTTIAANTVATTQITFNHQSPSLSFNTGDEIRVVVSIYKASYTIFTNVTNGYPASGLSAAIKFKADNTLLLKSVTSTVGIGDEVILTDFLPKLKQKDLISDLIKRYNLIISQDESNPNLLIFETYNDYYLSNTEILDWSSKKDYSKNDNITLLSEIQYKTAKFTYTADTTQDDVNGSYSGATQEVYGEFEYVFDNDFVKGERSIQSPFSPTPTIKTAFGCHLPSINRDNPVGNPRVLYYGGLMDLTGNNTWTLNGTVHFRYPYSGHFNHPTRPTLDLNFDWCRYYFYNDISAITTNNQYNTYWSSYFKQISTGKLLTSYFFLNEADIRKIKNKLSYKVWIKDSYYYINKIINYNPLNNDVTQVELIKATDLGYYVDVGLGEFVGGSTCPTDLYILTYTVGDPEYYLKSYTNQAIDLECCTSWGGTYNEINGTCKLPSQTPIAEPISSQQKHQNAVHTDAVVLGTNNKTGGNNVDLIYEEGRFVGTNVNTNKQLIVGDNNYVNSDRGVIVGDNNTFNNKSTVILNGDNNTVTSAKTTLIGTNNQTISDGNKVYLGNGFKVDVDTGEQYINGVKQGNTLTESIRITSTEILELFTNPKQLLPTSGTNRYYTILNVSCFLDFNTTVYAGDNFLDVYVNNADTNSFFCNNVLTETSDGVYLFEKQTITPPQTQSKLNEGVFIKTRFATTDGDSDIILTIDYKIVDLTSFFE